VDEVFGVDNEGLPTTTLKGFEDVVELSESGTLIAGAAANVPVSDKADDDVFPDTDVTRLPSEVPAMDINTIVQATTTTLAAVMILPLLVETTSLTILINFIVCHSLY
jgi:hypothetical protein